MALADYTRRSFWGWMKDEGVRGLKDAKFFIMHLLTAFSLLSLVWTFDSPLLREAVDTYRAVSMAVWSWVPALVVVPAEERLAEVLSFVVIVGIVRMRSAWLGLPSLPKKDHAVFALGILACLFALATLVYDPDLLSLVQGNVAANVAIYCVALLGFCCLAVLTERVFWKGESILPPGIGPSYQRDSVVFCAVTMVIFVGSYIALAATFSLASIQSPVFISALIVWLLSSLVYIAPTIAYVRSTVAIAVISLLLLAADRLIA